MLSLSSANTLPQLYIILFTLFSLLMLYRLEKISFHSTEMVQSVREGRDATVYCLVRGDPAPEISWLFNGEYINSE